MMYRTRGEALKALARLIDKRVYITQGEMLSPAEEWLVSYLYSVTPIRKSDRRRGLKKRYVGLARSLGLYPIPDWWIVREKIKGTLPKKEGEARIILGKPQTYWDDL